MGVGGQLAGNEWNVCDQLHCVDEEPGLDERALESSKDEGDYEGNADKDKPKLCNSLNSLPCVLLDEWGHLPVQSLAIITRGRVHGPCFIEGD